jgi:hypothetical protein
MITHDAYMLWQVNDFEKQHITGEDAIQWHADQMLIERMLEALAIGIRRVIRAIEIREGYHVASIIRHARARASVMQGTEHHAYAIAPRTLYAALVVERRADP